jgi:D-alanyl-D-alanine carboxypeptidase
MGYLRMLEAAADRRGVASLAVIERAGTAPVGCWVPGAPEEPAFLAYSITKIFTAVVVLALEEAGRLRLEDSLARWFPGVPRADRISLRHLLNHTSGIPDYGGLRSYHDGVRSSPSEPWSFERYGAETFERDPWFEPGEGWGYSNPGYLLLKRVAEAVTGRSYSELVSATIGRPLGLERTAVAETVADLAPLAPARSRLLAPDGAPRDVRACYHPGWVSHGVVASTASDLARFLDGLFGGRLLGRAALDRMTELVVVPGKQAAPASGEGGRARRGRPSYGLGLMGDPASPWGLVVGHNGGGPGYVASLFHAPELAGATVCAMAAIEDGFPAEELAFDVLDRLEAG